MDIVGIPELMFFHMMTRKDVKSEVVSGGSVNGIHCKVSPYLVARATIVTGTGCEEVTAILDTGADVCGISPQLEKRLQLEVYDRHNISGAISTEPSNVYMLRMKLGDGIEIKDAVTFVYPNFQDLGIDLVIGMNVLRNGDLTVKRNGTFTFEI